MFPIMLDLRDHRCLVVGGGGVALRKIEGLLEGGARVFVVAPAPMAAVHGLADAGRIELQARDYHSPEARDFALVFAATDDRAVNRLVYTDARDAGIWVNVADDPELCTFQLPARVQRGAMQLAIGSAGEAPFVVRRMRQLLERRFGPEWGEWMDAAARFRRAVRALALSKPEEEERFDRFFQATVDPEGLRARVPVAADEQRLLSVPVAGRENESAGSRAEVESSAEPKAGMVSLVGAGPGDPGLLTLRARQRMHAADVIVYDRLAAPALPCDLPADIELRCVGKESSHHPVPQEETNALLVRLALQGKRVVRLKGGDPVVFGRGGEEALVLVEAGIPFEIVPSVTAGVAVPAYAGIPVTSRREAVRLTLFTAHEAIKSDGEQVRWDLLAADPHATLVGYMGVTCIDEVVRRLIEAGMDSETPAAMIERGTTSRQRTVRTSLRELPSAVATNNLRPPGLFVIGPTVKHADRLDWFSSRPLQGERLVAPAPCSDLKDLLEMKGADVIEVPLPITESARVVLSALPITGAIVRSSDDVDFLDDERDSRGWSAEVVAWCIGGAAAGRARERGWAKVERLDDEVSLADLARAIERRRAAATD